MVPNMGKLCIVLSLTLMVTWVFVWDIMRSCALSLRDWMIWVNRTVTNGMLLPGEEQRRLSVHNRAIQRFSVEIWPLVTQTYVKSMPQFNIFAILDPSHGIDLHPFHPWFSQQRLTLFCLDGCNLYPSHGVFAISISCDLSHSHERVLSEKRVPPFQIKHQLTARSKAVCSFTVDGSPCFMLLLSLYNLSETNRFQ